MRRVLSYAFAEVRLVPESLFQLMPFNFSFLTSFFSQKLSPGYKERKGEKEEGKKERKKTLLKLITVC